MTRRSPCVVAQVRDALAMDVDHVGAAHFWLDILVVNQGDEEIGADLGVVHEVWTAAQVVLELTHGLQGAWFR